MLQARLLLIFAAFIWGSAFVTQRMVTDIIGPFSFNAIRFFIGALTLVPVMYFLNDTVPTKRAHIPLWMGGLIAGSLMFTGVALQQIALAHTTAGKAGFITALYIVLVPLVGLLFNQSLSFISVGGVLSALIGIALLTVRENFVIAWGDMLLLISTLFWTFHILTLTYLAPRFPCIRLSALQFLFCSGLSAIGAFGFEALTLTMVQDSLFSILYGGVLSAGVGFTLQTVCQKVLPPTEASLLLSLEMVFAGLTGWLVLGELMNGRELWGILFISCGVILAQLPSSAKYSIAPLHLITIDSEK